MRISVWQDCLYAMADSFKGEIPILSEKPIHPQNYSFPKAHCEAFEAVVTLPKTIKDVGELIDMVQARDIHVL